MYHLDSRYTILVFLSDIRIELELFRFSLSFRRSSWVRCHVFQVYTISRLHRWAGSLLVHGETTFDNRSDTFYRVIVRGHGDHISAFMLILACDSSSIHLSDLNGRSYQVLLRLILKVFGLRDANAASNELWPPACLFNHAFVSDVILGIELMNFLLKAFRSVSGFNRFHSDDLGRAGGHMRR